MVGEISAATRIKVFGAVRSLYRGASKSDESRMFGILAATVGCHWKYAAWLLGRYGPATGYSVSKGRLICDEAVR